VVATADPATLPGKTTWYLVTNLPRPGCPREEDSPWPAAPLAEIVRIYGIRHWIEQGYKQVEDELGWADFQVRSGIAIRHHQMLVNCAFSIFWDAWFRDHPAPHQPAAPRPGPGHGERVAARGHPPASAAVAAGTARDTRLAFPHESRCNAAGRHGPQRPRRRSYQALMNSVAADCGLHLLSGPRGYRA